MPDAKSVWSWRKLLKAVQSFYVDSSACVRVGNDVSGWYDTALVSDPEEKLCRLMSGLSRVCGRRKLRVNVGKSKVMRCSNYGNGGRMHVILNGEPLEEVNCFKYLESQEAADGGRERDVAHRMNEGYIAWRVLKSVLSNRGLGV